jgi:hypothetical protein
MKNPESQSSTETLSTTENKKGIESHYKAAKHFEAVAKSHLDAAKHHENENLDKASLSTIEAINHSKIAMEAQNEDAKLHKGHAKHEK